MIELTTNADNLRAEYDEVCENIRWLADVRFKLLGLIPLATILGAWFANSAEYTTILLISLFGLVITIALLIYNERNDQHYGELIARAKQLERALKLYGGQFSHRSGTRLRLWGFESEGSRLMHVDVNHSTAVYLIYQASITAWVFGILYPILFITLNSVLRIITSDSLSLTPPNNDDFAQSVMTLAAVIALVVAIVGVREFFRYLGRQKKARSYQMKNDAKAAMSIIINELSDQNYRDANKENWGKAINHLAVVKNAEFKRVIDEYPEKEELKKTKSRELVDLKVDAEKYLEDSIMPQVKEIQLDPERDVKIRKLAADLAASVTSLPARWYEEMARDSTTENNDRQDGGN